MQERVGQGDKGVAAGVGGPGQPIGDEGEGGEDQAGHRLRCSPRAADAGAHGSDPGSHARQSRAVAGRVDTLHSVG
jgi:hypothetical protein